MQKKIAIIGCGASGMMAAICAARKGAEVTIYEHGKPGKKILSTGNGKCNLTNDEMNENCFFSYEKSKLKACLDYFGKEDTKAFFESLGLLLKEKNGYYYPLSEQASMVQQILLDELNRLKIKIILDESVVEVRVKNKPSKGRMVEVITDKKNSYDSCIIACGSKAAPKTGSDGSGYELAKKLGHKLRPVLPSLVQLRCSDSYCKALAGIRTEAAVRVMDGTKELCCEYGELQLTDYGISGIPVFQLSGLVNRFLYENKKAKLVAFIDFLPAINKETWNSYSKQRINTFKDAAIEMLFRGILNQKLMNLFIKIAGVQPQDKVSDTDIHKLEQIFHMCKEFKFHIEGSNGFENAQVCTGGVDLAELKDDLESVYAPNVYFAGEILDVDGRCGGYNLQWAWTSGAIAGEAAAK